MITAAPSASTAGPSGAGQLGSPAQPLTAGPSLPPSSFPGTQGPCPRPPPPPPPPRPQDLCMCCCPAPSAPLRLFCPSHCSRFCFNSPPVWLLWPLPHPTPTSSIRSPHGVARAVGPRVRGVRFVHVLAICALRWDDHPSRQGPAGLPLRYPGFCPGLQSGSAGTSRHLNSFTPGSEGSH